MTDLQSDAASAAAGIDLSQFYQVFFEEAGENLDNLEQMLLHVDLGSAQDEDLNAIFRCAHSVKGGAATFGFADIAELTHQMESLLDKLRRHELSPTTEMVDVLLKSGDALRAMLGRHQGNRSEVVDTTDLLFNIKRLAEGGSAQANAAPDRGEVVSSPKPPVPQASAAETASFFSQADIAAMALAPSTPAPSASDPAPAPAAAPAPASGDPAPRLLELTVGPMQDVSQAEGIVELFKEVAGLGVIEPLDGGMAADGVRRFKVTSSVGDADLIDLFGFHVSKDQVRLAPLGPGYGFHPGAPGSPPDEEPPAPAKVAAPVPAQAKSQAPAPAPAPAAAKVEETFGFFDGAPGLPGSASSAFEAALSTAAPAVTPAGDHEEDTSADVAVAAPRARSAATSTQKAASAPEPVFEAAPSPAPKAPRPAPASKSEKPAAAANSAQADTVTLRVAVDKVDQLINLVGELVITQAMLAQNSKGVDPALYLQLAAGLSNLERNTRDLQEAVMSIRMIPMSMVFNRFPRMLRDLASKLGKKVDLIQVGEATELDKGLVEKITDPLTHLVRNSCDHGIETPEQRIARGKPEHGTISLVASHQGGSIVIEVRDDGRGLSRPKLLTKARERGIDAPDSLSDGEVWSLIFAPGFSTADVVTDVSGRGVGMDVVKRNITELGGSVEIDSAEGHGMTVRVRLPLTLAIMDGMSVGVGHECYILPLASVVESFQVTPETVKTVGGTGRVVEVRGEFMPVIHLAQAFSVPRLTQDAQTSIMVVVEAEGGRAALMVDELLGQQQVVVKNLESNYRKVQDVSGATIMGDGRVALILDVAALVQRSRH